MRGITITISVVGPSFHCKANVARAPENSRPTSCLSAPGPGHLPILHTEGVHVNDAVLVPTEDVVQLLVEPLHLVLVGRPFFLNVLKLIHGGLQVMLQRLNLKPRKCPY